MGKIAFVFAGQGSQNVSMGQDFYENFDCAKKIFDISPAIRDLCFFGNKEQLDITVNTQPALFLTELAIAAVLNERGIFADGAAGFSLGEIPAVCHAGIMDLEQGFDFVCFRAKVMQECAERNRGCMFAVLKLSADDALRICESIKNTWVVNYNCPGQVVVACGEKSSDELQSTVSENGGRVIKLAVSGAFHSPFMNGANEKISEYLADMNLKDAKLSLYSNIDAMLYDNPKELLSHQVNSPVLWQRTVENMIKDGFDTLIEVGPGKVLSGLIRKINGDLNIFNVSDIASLENTVLGIAEPDRNRNP